MLLAEKKGQSKENLLQAGDLACTPLVWKSPLEQTN